MQVIRTEICVAGRRINISGVIVFEQYKIRNSMVIKKIFIFFSLISLATFNVLGEPYQGNASLGPLKTPSCGFCHGMDGIATMPSYPNLRGQNEQYLFSSMKAYQNGNRKGDFAEMMRTQLSALNNQDLADIAAFYATMKDK
ncbi:MAG: cytochrome c553 [Psychromonas sp.]